MFNKRSQITLFIIFGIIILVTIVILISDLGGDELDINKVTQSSVPQITNYVESCIESVGKDAIIWIGEHGGYYQLPKYSTKAIFTNTAYYFYINDNLMPSKSEIEEELSEYMSEQLFSCLRNFVDFKKMGLEIEQGPIITTTMIRLNNVNFEVILPLIIKKQESVTKIEKFKKTIDSIRLNTIYEVSRKIIEEQMKDYDSICLSCMVKWGIENSLSIDINKVSNSSYLFTIIDNNSIIGGLPFKFKYANKYTKYSCSNYPPDVDTSYLNDCVQKQISDFEYNFYLENIPDMITYVGENFNYQVNASGLNLTFIDHTTLFNIDGIIGIINFVPSIQDVGNHSIWIEVIDIFGKEGTDSFNLNIIQR